MINALLAYFDLPIVLGILIVVVGLFIMGFKDLTRFSFRRVWAISSVAFDESIRRRVLLLTPLAVAGFIIVTQLQRPLDEQDAIRQTTKVCLFATGLLVTMAIIILACTNLPKEIENRVIYTIVTKPTTRLELVVGKVLGFARVSAAILLIMGLASYGYLQWRAHSMRQDINRRLDAGAVDPISRPTLVHYAQAGLLNARSFQRPADLQIYARPPVPGQDVWMTGGGEQRFIVPFDLKPEDLVPVGVKAADVAPAAAGVSVRVRLNYEAAPLTAQELERMAQEQQAAAAAATQPTTQPLEMGPVVPSTQPAGDLKPVAPTATAEATTATTQPGQLTQATQPTQPTTAPATQPLQRQAIIQVEILNQNLETIIPPLEINSSRAAIVPPPQDSKPAEVTLPLTNRGCSLLAQWLTDSERPLPPQGTRVYLQVSGASQGVDFAVGPQPVTLIVPSVVRGLDSREIHPAKGSDGQYQPPHFLGRIGGAGQQLRGDSKKPPVAVYSFRKLPIPAGEKVPFELRMGIEQQGADVGEEADVITTVSLEFYNRASHQSFSPILIHPENNRTAYFSAPAEAVAGGDFDVLLRAHTDSRWLQLRIDSLSLVSGDQPFAWNLFKSLLILWLMTVLIVIISIFSSTFLSWPIAIMLTLMLLLGRWGVDQLGFDRAGLSAAIGRDMGFSENPLSDEVFRRSFDLVSQSLQTLTRLLPDISRFTATEHIEQGVSIPLHTILQAVIVLGGFGLPLIVLAYIFLKNKEVAP